MGKRKQPLYLHVESVNALLDQLNQAAPGKSDWLEALRKRTLKKDVGWKAEADSYLRGLVGDMAIPEYGVERLRGLMPMTDTGAVL